MNKATSSDEEAAYDPVENIVRAVLADMVDVVVADRIQPVSRPQQPGRVMKQFLAYGRTESRLKNSLDFVSDSATPTTPIDWLTLDSLTFDDDAMYGEDSGWFPYDDEYSGGQLDEHAVGKRDAEYVGDLTLVHDEVSYLQAHEQKIADPNAISMGENTGETALRARRADAAVPTD